MPKLADYYVIIDQQNTTEKPNQISAYGLDYSVYEKLLPLTTIAAQYEQVSMTPHEQILAARQHALKLAVLFGNANEATAYLERYEKQYPHSPQLIHDACLFSLPEGNEWNISLWQGIISHHHPNCPNDLIMRLLPFAKKIEDYVQNNRNTITEKLRKEIENEYEKGFLQKYDEMVRVSKLSYQDKQVNIEQELRSYQKSTHRQAEREFDDKLRKELNLPSGKINDTQKQLLIEKKESSKKILKDIEARIKDEHIKKIVKDYEDESIYADLNKEDYLRTQKIKAAGEIKAAIDAKTASLLSATTSIAELYDYVKHALYTRAKENPEAAKLFFSYGIAEENFNHYLSLQLCDNAHYIPEVRIDGAQLNSSYENYYIQKLSPFDPRAAILGKLTSCCQSLGKEGETSAIHGMTDPRGGFYVLCKKMKGQPDIILSQCWAWRSKEGEIVFDSIESHLDFIKNKSIQLLISDFYTQLAGELVQKHHVPRVSVGKAPKNLGLLTSIFPKYTPNYDGYTDARFQRIIADKHLPLLAVYQDQNKSHVNLTVFTPTSTSMDSKVLEEWCDLCAASEKDEYMSYIIPLISMTTLNEEHFQNRFLLAKNYIEQLDSMVYGWATQSDLDKAMLFIEAGINPYIPDKKFNINNILHFAASSNQWDIVEKLIKNGMNVNIQDSYGENILYYAIKAGNLSIVQLLIKHNVNINAKNSDGLSALHYVFKNRINDTTCLAIVRELLNAGVDVNLKTAQQSTPLHYAINAGVESIKLLIEKGAEVNAKTKDGLVPVHYAALNGKLNIVKLLAAKGASLKEKDTIHNNTILHYAVQGQRLDLVVWLISQGVEIDVANKQGETPLDLAINMTLGNKEIVQALQHGEDLNVAKHQARVPPPISKEETINLPLSISLTANVNDSISTFLKNEPATNTARNELISDLIRYMNKINNHTINTAIEKNDIANINFKHGFYLFKNSRANNRRANYIAADYLKTLLETTNAPIEKIFDSHKIKLLREKNGASRSIHSRDLNKIIKKAMEINRHFKLRK